MSTKETKKNQVSPSPNGIELKARRTAFLARAVALVEPVLANKGLELVVASCPMENGYLVLRFCIERKAGEFQADECQPDECQASENQRDNHRFSSEVTLDDCAVAARAIGETLEAIEDSAPVSYLLEVSSPGLDRCLIKEADFQRFQGRLVKLKLRRDDGGCSGYKGRLTRDPSSGGLALDTPAGLVPFVFNQVTSCRLSLDDLSY